MHVVFGIGLLVALVGATAAFLKICPSAARAVLGEDPPDRVASLDGVRGVLALCVLLHHGSIAHVYCGDGKWLPPKSNFDNLLGSGAVAMFFMVSAYLFWGRVVRNRGRLKWVAFFWGRVLRLSPMFYAAVALLLAIVAVESHFTLRVSGAALAKQIGCWCAFGFMGIPDINQVKDTGTILSTLWTLQYEWGFYIALPFLALIYRAMDRDWWIIPGVFALAFVLGDQCRLLAYFSAGFLAVHFVNGKFAALWAGAGIAAAAALVVWFHDALGLIQPLLMFLVFVAAVQSRGPWAFTRWRPMRFLGHISYSFYLLHNPLIHIFTKWGFGYPAFARLAGFELYLAIFFMGLWVIAISTCTFVFIEKPFFTAKSRAAHHLLPATSAQTTN